MIYANFSNIAAGLLNTAGAIRADANASVTSAGSIGNVGGLVSAGDTLALMDANRAHPTAKMLSVVSTGGQLLAGKRLVLDAATFSGDGAFASGRDLTIALTQDIVDDATVSAAGDLSYATIGRLTNHGRLLAGRVLGVSGRDVDERAGALERHGQWRRCQRRRARAGQRR